MRTVNRVGTELWEPQIAECANTAWLIEGHLRMRSLGPSLLPSAEALILAVPNGGQDRRQQCRLWVRPGIFRSQGIEWPEAIELTGPTVDSSWDALNGLYGETLCRPRKRVTGNSLPWHVETELIAALWRPSGWERVHAFKEVVFTEETWRMTMNVEGSLGHNMTYVLTGDKNQPVDDALVPFMFMLFANEAPLVAAVGT